MKLRTEMQLSIRTRVPMLACAVLAVLAPGCALFNPGSAVERITAERPFLPPVQSERNVIDLEVYFVERVVGDPTIGDGLWRAVNQAAGSLSTHAKLRSEGIQYGVSPSSAPPALQSLIFRGLGSTETKVTTMHNIPVIPGASAPIHVGRLPESCTVPTSGKRGVGAVTAQQGECMFKVAAERLQEGWVKIAFLPQIHHGVERVRPIAGDEQWTAANSRIIESYYDQEFSLELNTGEFVVVGLAEDRPGTLGHLFFRNSGTGSRFQRVMIVRLAGMQAVKPMRSDRGTF